MAAATALGVDADAVIAGQPFGAELHHRLQLNSASSSASSIIGEGFLDVRMAAEDQLQIVVAALRG